MMRASWHSMQAVMALLCRGPGGRSSGGFWGEPADCPHNAAPAARASAASISALRGHMNFHLIDGVVEITAGVPSRLGRLGAALAVARARHDYVVAALGWLPVVAPQAPGIVSLLAAELRRIPTVSAVGRNFHFHDVRFTRPCNTVNLNCRGLECRAVTGTGDQGLHRQAAYRMRVLGLHALARLHRFVGHAVAGIHEVAFKLRVEDLNLREPFARCGAHPGTSARAGGESVVRG